MDEEPRDALEPLATWTSLPVSTNIMGFGNRKAEEAIQVPMSDPSEWMLNNTLSEFLLMPGAVMYMCMLGYTYLHGCKVFKTLPETYSVSYKFISMLLACTGGGILVPIFLNGIPVPLANDAYPIAIITSFALHYYFPTLREVASMSSIVKVSERVDMNEWR